MKPPARPDIHQTSRTLANRMSHSPPEPEPAVPVHAESIFDSRRRIYALLPQKPFSYGRDAHVSALPAQIYIGIETVRRTDFLEFINATNYPYDDESRELMDLIAPDDLCPATPVSWNDAKNYIRWMRSISGEYYSLPMDREWEFAARGQYGLIYPWGTVAPTRTMAQFSRDEQPTYQTVPVGTHPDGKSPFGCMDMVGNVWEWTLDTYEDENIIHGLRGGSAMDGIDAIRCTSRRFEIDEEKRVPYAGFRMTYLPGDMLQEYRTAVASQESPGEKTLVYELAASLEINPLRGMAARKNRR